ncbi:hypothetical protein NE237_011931 [Protea cynaroides]|uniref:RNase H type-1 domain-containing protein n=1 Tax=Protea cynaroides TaxID=273540 RepID=A0A9Q0GYV4_9MAGN|nr:hypothetical protein NE237_011931 [Protea cynaroides]
MDVVRRVEQAWQEFSTVAFPSLAASLLSNEIAAGVDELPAPMEARREAPSSSHQQLWQQVPKQENPVFCFFCVLESVEARNAMYFENIMTSPNEMPPPASHVKVNTDAAWMESKPGDVGFILRYSTWTSLVAVSKPACLSSIAYGEAMALREGFHSALEIGFNQIQLESNCLEITNMLKVHSQQGDIHV